MKIYSWNSGWEYRRLGEGAWQEITLPHDAMFSEKRTQNSAGGSNSGWYEGYDYEYRKKFFIPEEGKGKKLLFCFEGVYHNAEVELNGKRIAYRPYGYTRFFAQADNLQEGENLLRIIARNADQPNSRWYSGGGIYRPVWLYILEEKGILPDGLKVRTLSHSPARVELTLLTDGQGEAEFSLFDGDTLLTKEKAVCDEKGIARTLLTIENAKLWTAETPYLYRASAKFNGEEIQIEFGARTISCSAESGLLINGKRVILRGACIHHDNGLLGAACYDEAVERKARLLKESGYNAIRSAHNPCSKALLTACDRLGMYVMDEYADMWYIRKTKYDYAGYLQEWYEQDLTEMVNKDYNHPSVIIYSLGNEVAETGEKKGIDLFRAMRDIVKRLDDRPITAGVNIFFNLLYSLGFGVYSDKKAEKAPKKKVGSEFFNQLAGKLGDGFMKRMATLRACDKKTRDCFAEMDIAGYNYGILRYKKDIKKYPKRVIVGSETFCSDGYAFWETAKANPAVIGDFVWAGMDYLGEVAVGSWEYGEYAPKFTPSLGWVSAGSGRLNLIGTPSGETLYTKVAFEVEPTVQIAVRPVSFSGQKHSPSAWKMTDAMPSWTWEGSEGKKAKVEVYARAAAVELYLNGKKVGRKKRKKDCKFLFTTKYRAGELMAIAYDKAGKELSRNSLKTAGKQTQLTLLAEKKRVKAGELCFVRLRLTDEKGEIKPCLRTEIALSVVGGRLLAAGNACPYRKEDLSDKTQTYYGEAIAIARAERGKTLIVEGKSEYGSATAEINVE